MDSCQTSTTVDSMCQMNGNSSAQSLDSYPTLPSSLESDPIVTTNTALSKSSSTETMTSNTAVIESHITTNGSVSVEQQTQTDLIDDCLQDTSQTLVSTGSATQSLITPQNNTINAIK